MKITLLSSSNKCDLKPWRLFGTAFFSLRHSDHFFAETFWSLKHFGRLSHGGIKTRRSTAFQLIFTDILTEVALTFFDHFKMTSADDRKKAGS